MLPSSETEEYFRIMKDAQKTYKKENEADLAMPVFPKSLAPGIAATVTANAPATRGAEVEKSSLDSRGWFSQEAIQAHASIALDSNLHRGLPLYTTAAASDPDIVGNVDPKLQEFCHRLHQNKVGDRGQVSPEWWALVHTPIPMAKAMKMPRTREKVDEE